MSTPKELIESGILEIYILGSATAEEKREVESMAAAFPEIREELERIEFAIEQYARDNAIAPDPAIKAFLLATIDYAERMKKGAPFEKVPLLSAASKAEDFSAWLSRPEMQLQEPLENVYVKIISCSSKLMTAIVWARHYTPPETHDNELECFFILEGSCIITIDEESHELNPGDFITIPLHRSHKVAVTSPQPCKVILQRIAA